MNTNKKIAKLLGVPLIGCASHRFNLALKLYLRPYFKILDSVNNIMVKLRNIKLAARLRQQTELVAVIRNDTRWSSTYNMIKRYPELKEFLPHVCPENDDFMDLILNKKETASLEKLFKELTKLQSVTEVLQSPNITMLQVRQIFDKVIMDFPETKQYLSEDAEIILFKDFESGIVKLLSNKLEI